MPYYQYRCKNKDCETEFEEFYSSIKKAEEEEPETECPKCGSKDKERVPSLSSFILKGAGWAKDRYR